MTRPCNPWTHSEIKFLIENYHNMPTKKIKEKLRHRHTVDSIYSKAKQIGLSYSLEYRLRAAEDGFIVDGGRARLMFSQVALRMEKE